MCLVIQSYLTLWDPVGCSPPGSSVHGDSPGKNTGVGCHDFLQGIFPTQELNQGLLYCRQILYQLSYQRTPDASRCGSNIGGPNAYSSAQALHLQWLSEIKTEGLTSVPVYSPLPQKAVHKIPWDLILSSTIDYLSLVCQLKTDRCFCSFSSKIKGLLDSKTKKSK